MRPQNTLVFVHGLFGHLNIPEVIEHLHDYEVLTPDLIGYGGRKHESVASLTMDDQVNVVIEAIENHGASPVHLIGHSVGGAVGMLVAAQRPELLASVISVEGNFTLNDAFWSQQISKMTVAEVVKIVEGYCDDPDRWMSDAVEEVTPLASRLAREWLDNQPATTIRAQAGAVVNATGDPGYLDACRSVMSSTLPVSLISGARSAAGWDTPQWTSQLCAGRINIPDAGHLMMVESPARFASAIALSVAITGLSTR